MANQKKSPSKIYYETAGRAGRPPAFNPNFNQNNKQSSPSGRRHQCVSSSRDGTTKISHPRHHHGQPVPASRTTREQHQHHHQRQHSPQPKPYHDNKSNGNNNRRASLKANHKKTKDSKEWLRTPSQASSKAWLKSPSFSTISTFDPNDPQFTIPQSPPQPNHTNSKAWLYVEEQRTREEYPADTFRTVESEEAKDQSRRQKRRRSKKTTKDTKKNKRQSHPGPNTVGVEGVKKKKKRTGVARKIFCFRKNQ